MFSISVFINTEKVNKKFRKRKGNLTWMLGHCYIWQWRWGLGPEWSHGLWALQSLLLLLLQWQGTLGKVWELSWS